MHHRALIFDFGNVIAHFDFERAASRLGAASGRTGRAILDGLERAGSTGLQREFEHGRLTNEAFGARWLALAGIEADLADFEAAWSDIFTPNLSIFPLVAALHDRGYPLILGSNTNALHAAHFRHQFAEVLDRFGALVLSHEIGHMKPAAEFYKACVRAAGRPPSDCVFIDDLAANVAGAQSAGMTAILYTTTPQLVVDLAAMGIGTDPAASSSLGPAGLHPKSDASGRGDGAP